MIKNYNLSTFGKDDQVQGPLFHQGGSAVHDQVVSEGDDLTILAAKLDGLQRCDQRGSRAQHITKQKFSVDVVPSSGEAVGQD